MTKKGALFQLIKSMSRSEKRYFRLSANNVDAVYIRLFLAIEKQDEYNEELLKKQFKGEKFARQLHVAKNYLHTMIMRSLRNFYSGASIKATVLDLLRDAEILLNRELYDHCENTLAKAEELCRKFEYQPVLLEVMHTKRRLTLARGAGQSGRLAEIQKEESVLLHETIHLNSTWQLTSALFSRVNDIGFLRSDIISNKSVYSTLRSETLRRHMRYSWCFVNGKRKKAEKEINDLLVMLEENPGYISEDPGPYVTALGNKIGMLLAEKRWKETNTLLVQMRSVPEKYKLKSNSRFTLRLWLRLFNLELEFYRDSGNLAGTGKLVNEITSFLQVHRSAVPLNYVLLFRFQFALVQFEKGEFRASLREINEIINGDFDNERMDLQCSARIMNLVVHFELGNILVLRYIVDSTQRFLLKHKGFHASEKILLTLFRKLCRAEKSEFGKLFQIAEKTMPVDSELNYFDFRKWIKTKVL